VTVHHLACDLVVLDTARLAKRADLIRQIESGLPNPRKICIYVIACDRLTIYVGSSKNVGRTLATGHSRDYPYKWLKQHCGRTLKAFSFSFDRAFEGLKAENVREAIEGEVVFEIRRRTGRWPEAQNEIHFWESLRSHPEVTACVDQVLNVLETAGLIPGDPLKSLLESEQT
jgi:predicted GIY-YIG superfamily endonuclease